MSETKLLPSPDHLELKDHIESGFIPEKSSLGEAVINELVKVGLEVNPPPKSEPQTPEEQLENQIETTPEIKSEPQRTAEQILQILKSSNPEDSDITFGPIDAETLIKDNEGSSVARYLDKFQGLDHTGIANRLIKTGYGESVAKHLEEFQGLDHTDIANKFIEAGRGRYVAVHLDKFQGLDHTDIANKLFKTGNGESVARYLDKFQGLDHTDIANKFFKTGNGGYIAVHLDKFQGLDHTDIANKLIEAGDGASVAWHLDKFQGLDHTDIANKLIEAGGGKYVAKHLEEFQGLDHTDIANKLIEAGDGKYVAKHLEEFQGLDHTDIANKLIEAGRGRYVAVHLDKFQGLDHTDIANKLFKTGDGGYIAVHLDKFQGLDHTDIANKLIEAGYGGSVAGYLDKFHTLPGDKILVLMDDIEPDKIKNYLFRFTEIPEDTLVVLREKFNMPELTNMPRPWTDENGEHQPSTAAVDRWYGDLSYVYMEGGFNKSTIGRLIRLQIEGGLCNNIHDASQWLSTFRIPETSYDIETILNQRESSDFNPTSLDGFRTTLINRDAEKQFIAQLLEADQSLRSRLNYEGAQHELSNDDKLGSVFSLKPELQKEFNAQLGRETGQLTETFYNELLADPDIKQQYDEAIVSGTARRKFFKDLLKKNTVHAEDFNQRCKQLHIDITDSFCNSVLASHPELSDAINKNNKAINNESWFFAPENQLLFRAAMDRIDSVPLYKQSDFSTDTLLTHAEQMADSFCQTTAFGRGKEESSHNLSTYELLSRLDKMREYLQTQQTVSGSIGGKAQALAQSRLVRDNYLRDTQSWLMKHAMSPHDRLTKVWGDRPIALAYGEADNAKVIELWQTENALRLKTTELESTGELQTEYELSYNEVMGKTKKPVRIELTRRLSADNTLDAMSKLKKWTSRRIEKGITSILPAASVKVEINKEDAKKAYKFDILDKQDPRGFTIGEDTYCCMTINGVSEDCIKAGYTKENCGFVAAYNGSDTMVAQSFWFINKERPDVLVMDNIEANKGQDLQQVAEVYRQALMEYLKSHPELGITKVHVGTGHTDINLGDMPKVEAVPTLKDINYSDATNQRLLLDLSLQ
jgi:hypothetical protein